MSGYYSPSPAPTPPPPAEGWLPYPWVSQFDPNYQATYYANAETGETTWTRPDPNIVYSQPPPPDVVAAVEQSASHRGGDGSSMYEMNSHAPPSSSNGGGGGEAASFYSSAGVTPQAPSQSVTSIYPSQQQSQQEYGENGGQPVDGERGLGKVIIGGGLAYFAYKKYKEYQKGKLNQQQFKPPYQAPNPSNQTPQLHPPHGNYNYVHYPQEHFGPPKRDDVGANNGYAVAGQQPPMPAWDQKPSPAAYGGPPPNAYNGPPTNTPYLVSDLFLWPM